MLPPAPVPRVGQLVSSCSPSEIRLVMKEISPVGVVSDWMIEEMLVIVSVPRLSSVKYWVIGCLGQALRPARTTDLIVHQVSDRVAVRTADESDQIVPHVEA